MQKRVGVVGAGTAGLATALFLARQGHAVTVFDKTSRLGAAGAGIGIQPIGLTVLKRLGLLEPVVAHGARIERLYGETDGGRPVLDLTYGQYREELFGLGLHRGALFSELYSAAVGQDRVDFQAGCEVEQLHIGPQDSSFTDASGHEHGPFDLLVVADGRVSVRESVSDSVSAWCSWYVVVLLVFSELAELI
jgi:2-polyprenyl-6-methoxyphenol hydroxylase-like FAD-dependent oxidoreductase